MPSSRFFLAAAAACALLRPARADAANVLFVADGTNDTGIATALMADGHTVTMRTNDLDDAGRNASLAMDLSEYDVVFWSASGGVWAPHGDAEMFRNLTDYVRGGGRVMVVGYDATLGEPMLVSFLGATSSSDEVGVAPAAIASVDTSLTTGVRDVRGMVPTDGSYDKDCLSGLGPDVTLVTPSTRSPGCGQWTLRRLGDGEIAWVSNGDSFGSHASWTAPSSAFNAAIRNFASAADTASREPGAPVIELDRVFSADEGSSVTITVTVTDEEGDPVTWSWDTDDDGTFGELANMPSFTVPAGTTDGDGTIRVAVQASDGVRTSTRRRSLRIVNVPPRITSTPPTVTSVGATLRYRIEIDDPAGPLDPPGYALVRGPADATIRDDGLLTWSPDELDVTRPGETITFEVAVDDGDGGTATQVWEMTVSPNRPPDGLTLLYPANGIVIADPTPRLVVGNGTDPDPLDVLRYFFELDDDPEFAEPVLVRSGEQAQAVGYTAFEIDEPLTPGRPYYWRAWMSDGTVSTEPLATSFLLVPDPRIDGGTQPLDAGTAETDAGPREGPPPDGRAGCSCAVPARRASDGAVPIAIAVAVVGLVARRRPAQVVLSRRRSRRAA